MIKSTYTFTELNQSSRLIRDFIQHSDSVKPFIADFFSTNALIKQAQHKSFTKEKREQLFSALQKQYQGINVTKETQKNLEELKNEHTFTITTGHQLNLLSGPLYFIYKILQVVLWTEKMNKKNTDFHFVPVFWLASEDHDFEEINHIHLFGDTLSWDKNKQESVIAGRIVMDEAFEVFKQDVLDKYRNPELQEKINSFISDFWQKGMTLTQATKAFVNHYFGQYGVVMIDGDDSELKQSFLPVVKEELSQKFTFHVVNQTNQALSDASYHQQVYLRECNLFYINENGRRIRIETVEKGFQLDQSIYSAEELIEKAEQSPESFSPNALLRPVYQEMILPNIMYLGGGGEMAYWMQLKSVFKHLNLDFPILKVRDSYVILSDSDIQFMEELSYDLVDLKTSYDALAKEFVKENATEVLNFKTENDLFELLSKSMRKKTAVCYDNTQRFLEAN